MYNTIMKHKNKFKEFESVGLAHNIEKKGLEQGERGVVVEIYNDGEAYEVEFIKPNGGTKALLTLIPNEIFPIIREVEVSYHKPQVVSESNTLSMKTKHIKNCKFEIQAKMSEEKTEEFDYQFA